MRQFKSKIRIYYWGIESVIKVPEMSTHSEGCDLCCIPLTHVFCLHNIKKAPRTPLDQCVKKELMCVKVKYSFVKRINQVTG
jgi:hypothetical protein